MAQLRLKEMAQQKRMSKTDLHMKSGLSYSNVNRYWENQVKNISLKTLQSLATVLGCSVKDLIADDTSL